MNFQNLTKCDTGSLSVVKTTSKLSLPGDQEYKLSITYKPTGKYLDLNGFEQHIVNILDVNDMQTSCSNILVHLKDNLFTDDVIVELNNTTSGKVIRIKSTKKKDKKCKKRKLKHGDNQ